MSDSAFYEDEPLEEGLHCMDVTTGLSMLPDCSVDLVMMDGPYFISNGSNSNKEINKFRGRKLVNFGDWDLDNDPEKLRPCIEQCARIMKNGASIIVWSGWEALYPIKLMMQENGVFTKRKLLWIKKNWHPLMTGRGWANAHEEALWATKSEGWTSHTFRKVGGSADWVFGQSVIEPTARIHDCQKPTEVYYYFMKELLRPFQGQTVVEPFAGSAPAYSVAKSFGCKYYGFDKDADMVAKARILRKMEQP